MAIVVRKFPLNDVFPSQLLGRVSELGRAKVKLQSGVEWAFTASIRVCFDVDGLIGWGGDPFGAASGSIGRGCRQRHEEGEWLGSEPEFCRNSLP